jgi:type I restriction enzyme S subunit
MNNGLPRGWALTSLEELVEEPMQDIVDGPFGSNLKASSYVPAGVPIVRLQNIDRNRFLDKNIRFVTLEKAAELARHSFRAGDIIITKLGDPVGKACVVPPHLAEGIIVADVVRARIDERRSLIQFVAYAINSPQLSSQLNLEVKGSTRPRVNLRHIRSLKIRVAPLNEQRRIVAKLETLLDKVDSSQRLLAKIPILLKRFRQAVLAAACSGDLTADWREANLSIETAEELITRTARQRQTTYALLHSKNYSGGKRKLNFIENFKPKLKEEWDLDALPDTWAWVDLHFLMSPSEPFCYGVVQPGSDEPDGIPLVRAGDLDAGKVNLFSLRRIPIDVHEQYPRSQIRGGELLVTVVGAGIGEAAIAQLECAGFNIARAVAKIPIREFSAAFVYHWLCTTTAVAWMKGQSREVARPTLNLEQLQTIPVPLPPLPEQQQIVRRVDELLALADEVEARHGKAKQYVDNLKQSILAKAFRGELVPQDPNDEPASVLLERVRDARANQEPVRSRRRVTTSP